MRILSWNMNGSRDEEKRAELFRIIGHWSGKDGPVAIICLQEVSVTDEGIKAMLTQYGFEWAAEREGHGGKGRLQLVAIKADFVSAVGESSVMDLPLDDDEEARHVRLPMAVPFADKEDNPFLVINYHAPLDGYRFDMLSKLDDVIREQVGQFAAVFLAGDLNAAAEDGYIPCITGTTSSYSRRLGHIFSWNWYLDNGFRGDVDGKKRSASDHLPISSSFGLPPEEAGI